MAKVPLSFDDRFRQAMLEGTKRTTCRPERKGGPGDIFEAFGAQFVILRVIERPLAECINDYEVDGFSGPSEFFKFWIDTYGRWEPYAVAFQHWFMPKGEQWPCG